RRVVREECEQSRGRQQQQPSVEPLRTACHGLGARTKSSFTSLRYQRGADHVGERLSRPWLGAVAQKRSSRGYPARGGPLNNGSRREPAARGPAGIARRESHARPTRGLHFLQAASKEAAAHKPPAYDDGAPS